MPKIIFDTAAGSTNLGDFIIMDSVNEIANELLKDDFLLHIPTHLRLHPFDLPQLRKYEMAWVGGTNLLKNDQFLNSQWKLDALCLPFLSHKTILMGVGWWQYQSSLPSLYSQWFFKNLLSKRYNHSVRDNYTKQKLAEFGIKNVINTGCPTVWKLTPAHCEGIPVRKGEVVVTTITDYLKDPVQDKKMLLSLKKNYKEVYIWIQGSQDEPYVRSLVDGIQIIGPKLSLFDEFLKNTDCDYVGTRLHAGIRAMQMKRKSLIIGIDNRALEMHKDIGLPVLNRAEIDQLDEVVMRENKTELHINWEAINKWKNQFRSL